MIMRVAVMGARTLEYGPSSDEALVALARNGDFSAFEALFERHRVLAYRFAYQILNSSDDAEDVVQEAFVKSFQNIHRYREQAKFSTWLLRIISNLCTDQKRTFTRRNRLEQQEANGALDWMTKPVEFDPTEDMIAAEQRSVLRNCLKQIAVHHRTAVVLRDIEERSYEEIAGIFQCSVGGAKLRVLRARRALKTSVEKHIKEQNLELSHYGGEND